MKQKPEIKIKSINEEAEKNIAEYGFHMWYLTDKDSEMINCFTQGLDVSYNHKNLQIVLPIENTKAANIMHTLVDGVKAGKEITSNNIHNGLLSVPILAVEVEASPSTQNLEVIRIIFPDGNGKFAHEDECDAHYKLQLS